MSRDYKAPQQDWQDIVARQSVKETKIWINSTIWTKKEHEEKVPKTYPSGWSDEHPVDE